MSATARDFTDWLEDVALSTWHGVALACPTVLAPDAARQLERALGAPEMALDIWTTKDDLAAALWRFASPEGRWLARSHRQRGHLASVTERAALALVVRQRLRDVHFAQAFGAFGEHFPI